MKLYLPGAVQPLELAPETRVAEIWRKLGGSSEQEIIQVIAPSGASQPMIVWPRRLEWFFLDD